MLSDAHRVALEKLKEQMRQHKLEWIRPYSSRLFEGANIDRVKEGFDRWVQDHRAPISQKWELLPQRIFVDTIARICLFIEPVQVLRSPPIIKTWGWARICTDIVHFHLFGHLKPVWSHNICTDLVAVGPVVDRSGIPRRTVNNVQYCIRIVDSIRVPSTDANPNISSSTSSSSAESESSSSSSSTSSPIDFVNEETPDAQTLIPTAIVSSNDYTNAFAQLKDSVDQISLEQVQTIFHIEKLKTALFTKISILETAFLTRSDNQDRVVLVQIDVLHKEMQAQKAALSQELDVFRKEVQDQKADLSNDLMEFCVQAQENFNTLTAQLSELVAYINKAMMPKRGK
ncbi:hypothetical protein F511_37961 [Dorcoceras hygrometricum]|uniref:Uncharacterized protein n=1 Tax=Dorcoceras hygrometricum TaxID=472368 RepID=A0A2Z7DC70_9LAMI|nr:hypothetical protein F511_37961 [Dorcoceras hygrometricum]